MKKCKTCGCAMKDDDLFCSKCGTSIITIVDDDPKTEEKKDSETKIEKENIDETSTNNNEEITKEDESELCDTTLENKSTESKEESASTKATEDVKIAGFSSEETDSINENNKNKSSSDSIQQQTQIEKSDRYSSLGVLSIIFGFIFAPIGLIIGICGLCLSDDDNTRLAAKVGTCIGGVITALFIIAVVALIIAGAKYMPDPSNVENIPQGFEVAISLL